MQVEDCATSKVGSSLPRTSGSLPALPTLQPAAKSLKQRFSKEDQKNLQEDTALDGEDSGSGSDGRDGGNSARIPNNQVSQSITNFQMGQIKALKTSQSQAGGNEPAWSGGGMPGMGRSTTNDDLRMSEVIAGVKLVKTKTMFQKIKKGPTRNTTMEKKNNAIVTDYAKLTRSLTKQNILSEDHNSDDEKTCCEYLTCTPLHPHSKSTRCWDYFTTCLLFVAMMYDPLRLAIVQDLDWPIAPSLDIVFDLFFLTDMIVAFRVSRTVDNQNLSSCYSIAHNYVSTRWFYLDLLCCLPVRELLAWSGFPFQVVSIVSLIKVLRAFKFQRSLHLHATVPVSVSSSRSASQLTRFLVMMFRIFVGSHWFACGWFFVSFQSQMAEDVYSTWVEANGVTHMGPGLRYIYSLYWAWATLTSTGYGDIKAENQYEMMYCVLIMLFGIAAVAYGTATVSSVLYSMDIKGAKQQENAGALKQFLEHAQLPRLLNDRVRRHLDYTMSHAEEAQTMQRFFLLMPSDLQITVAKTMYGSLLEAVPFLQNQDDTFVTQFIISLHACQYAAGERMAEKGKASSEIFVLKKGHLYFTENNRVTSNFFPGALVGVVPLVTGTWPCDAYAMVNSTLLSISKRRLISLFTEYPDTKVQLMKLGSDRLGQIRKLLKSKSGGSMSKTATKEGSMRSAIRDPTSPPRTRRKIKKPKVLKAAKVRIKKQGGLGLMESDDDDYDEELEEAKGPSPATPPKADLVRTSSRDPALTPPSATDTISPLITPTPTATDIISPLTSPTNTVTAFATPTNEHPLFTTPTNQPPEDSGDTIPGVIPNEEELTTILEAKPASPELTMPRKSDDATPTVAAKPASEVSTQVRTLRRSIVQQRDRLSMVAENQEEMKDMMQLMMDRIQSMAQLMEKDHLFRM